MGLMDVITGVMNGPRGQPAPQTGAKGGLSPMTMAVLGVLAYKVLKSSGVLGGAQPTGQSSSAPSQGGRMASTDAPGGSLADMLGGIFGGASVGTGNTSGPNSGAPGNQLGGAAAGAVLSSGLSNLIKDLQNAGQGQAAQSWVGTGPNQPIEPNALGTALGPETIDVLVAHTGMSREQLLSGLSRHLPGIVDQLTPQGRLLSEGEAAQLLDTTWTEEDGASARRPH